MEYLFIDLENIAPESLATIPENHCVYIFAGEKQTKLPINLAESMLARGGAAKLIRIKGSGKNALDFHIAFYLGKVAEREPKAAFRILSKDKGFDALIGHLNATNIDCARIEKIASRSLPENIVRTKLEEFSLHLRSLGERARPKKVAKLKAYLKNWAQKDESMVEPIIKGLLSKGHIEFDGERIKYQEIEG